MKAIFEQIIQSALATESQIDIYTLALHYDHHAQTASVCIDSKANSDQQVREQNAYNLEFFKRIVADGNLNEAALWQANSGRNLNLADFRAPNISEYAIAEAEVDHSFYVAMVQAIIDQADNIAAHSSHGGDLLFCASTAHAEVGLIWSYLSAPLDE